MNIAAIFLVSSVIGSNAHGGDVVADLLESQDNALNRALIFKKAVTTLLNQKSPANYIGMQFDANSSGLLFKVVTVDEGADSCMTIQPLSELGQDNNPLDIQRICI